MIIVTTVVEVLNEETQIKKEKAHQHYLLFI